jgi:hypothetical protein
VGRRGQISAPLPPLCAHDDEFQTSYPSILLSGCFTCCMESGLRIYNVDPLVEKAHFGKFTVVSLLDVTYCILVESVHT